MWSRVQKDVRQCMIPDLIPSLISNVIPRMTPSRRRVNSWKNIAFEIDQIRSAAATGSCPNRSSRSLRILIEKSFGFSTTNAQTTQHYILIIGSRVDLLSKFFSK